MKVFRSPAIRCGLPGAVLFRMLRPEDGADVNQWLGLDLKAHRALHETDGISVPKTSAMAAGTHVERIRDEGLEHDAGFALLEREGKVAASYEPMPMLAPAPLGSATQSRLSRKVKKRGLLVLLRSDWARSQKRGQRACMDGR